MHLVIRLNLTIFIDPNTIYNKASYKCHYLIEKNHMYKVKCLIILAVDLNKQLEIMFQVYRKCLG